MSNASNLKIINCAASKKPVRLPQNMKCSKCASYFHAICVNVTDLSNISEEAKSAWVCPDCKIYMPKSDNTNTPVRAAAFDELRVAIGSVPSSKMNAPICSALATTDPDPLGSLIAKLKLMREERCESKTRLQIHVKHVTSKIEELRAKRSRLKKRDATLKRELYSLRSAVADIQDQPNDRAQAALKNEIEISGLPETKDEHLIHIVRVTAQTIGVAIDENDLDYVIRVGPLNSNRDRSTAFSKLPRLLVVRFVRRHKRDDFLKAAKATRNLASADLGVDGPSRKLYFNERLTRENKLFFRFVRLRSREAGFRFCWIKNGTIYIRSQEGAPATAIKSPDDLKRCLANHQDVNPAPLLS